MNTFAKLFIVAVSVISSGAFAQDTIERKPLVIGTKIETGQIVQGSPAGATPPDGDPDGNYISQIGVSLTQEVVVNRRLNVKVGAGGVFYSVFPSVPNNFGTTLGTKFGPGITQAQAVYKFGENPDKSWGALRIGYFGYKYNPDAKNLGEYLFRAGAYPTFAFTGGWSITDNAMVKAQGVEFSLSNFDGALKQSFMIANERDFRPAGDFTPSYVVEYTQGPVQIGGGVAFYHYFPIKERTTNPRDIRTAYYQFGAPGTIATVDPITGDSVSIAAGTSLVASYGDVNIVADALGMDADSLRTANLGGYYETKAIKLMGRASFSIQKIFPLDFLNPQDLKVYSEIALLGTKNYPGMYEKRTERMPIMAGINLPTFKLLDVLSFEMEYFKNTNPDDFGSQQLWQLPTYYSNEPNTQNQTGGAGGLAVPREFGLPTGYSILFRDANGNARDDLKWSVYAVKQVITGVSLRAQVANDHFRAQDGLLGGGYWTAPSLTRTPKDWYYVVAVTFGI
jgi:hypothetical protein